MSYFRELPDLLYPSFLSDKNSSFDYVEVKNYFRRIKLRDDLHNVFTLFDKYQIPQGSRPDTVAEEFYGSAELDWVVLMTAGIINVRDEWPLEDNQIYNYSLEKYGADLNATKFYETKEIKDSKGRLIMPKGKHVDSNFSVSYYDGGNVTVSGTDARTGVSNYIYEVRKNDDKRGIYLLKQGYLQQFLNDMRNIMTYDRSSEYINDKMIMAVNVDLLMP
tara:strand:- start:343 stop:999 length:657 start_codon:yes stop_codon:yes gene_type:complete